MRIAICLLVLCACADASGKIRLVPNVVAGKHDPGVSESALRIGSPSAMQLHSLKYFIRDIQLCEGVDFAGSGYSNLHGCITLYKTPGSLPSYDDYTVSEAQADDSPDHYVDLMSAEGQATLHKPVALEVPVADDANAEAGPKKVQSGVFRYGLIDFFRPIKVSAEFPVLGQADEWFRTRAVTRVQEGRPQGAFSTERVEIGDTRTGDTEETVYMLNNGGVIFTFQKPFVITQADVEAQAEIRMDLVFNPESFGQAYEVRDCNQDWIAICDPQNHVAIDMPYVRMSPVPRKAGQRTRKETYLLDYNTHSKLRLELYYNDADEEAVQGVDVAVVYEPGAETPDGVGVDSQFVSQTGSIGTGDAAVITLHDYAGMPSLTGLVRRQSGHAILNCLHPGSVCPSTGMTVERAYTYVGDSVVSAD